MKLPPELVDLVKFDKSKPFGEVHPPENGAHYEQNGFYFRADGSLCETMFDEKAVNRLKEIKVRREAQEKANAVLRQALIDAGLEPGEQTPVEQNDGSQMTVGNVSKPAKKTEEEEKGESDQAKADAIAWAKGEKKFQFFEVRKLFETGWSRDISSKKNALDFLLDEKLITEADIKV